MPAPRFLKSKEIASYMGISLREAQWLMTSFQMSGMAVTVTKPVTAREKSKAHSDSRPGRPLKMIDATIFTHWLSEQDGRDEKERLHEIQSFLANERRNEVKEIAQTC